MSIGLQNLRRYFELIVFQSYLQSTEPDTMQEFESVETYVKNRPGKDLSVYLMHALTFKPVESDQNIRKGASGGGHRCTETARTS